VSRSAGNHPSSALTAQGGGKYALHTKVSVNEELNKAPSSGKEELSKAPSNVDRHACACECILAGKASMYLSTLCHSPGSIAENPKKTAPLNASLPSPPLLPYILPSAATSATKKQSVRMYEPLAVDLLTKIGLSVAEEPSSASQEPGQGAAAPDKAKVVPLESVQALSAAMSLIGGEAGVSADVRLR